MVVIDVTGTGLPLGVLLYGVHELITRGHTRGVLFDNEGRACGQWRTET